MTTPRILIIAGSDSGGGAGIQADIKTVTMLGGHAMTAITAITAQNTLGMAAVMPVPAEMVAAQIAACVDDIGVDAVKIGMIGSAETAHVVADAIERLGVPVVFDPVMIATSGDTLADDATVAAFDRLMRAATVVTPNQDELVKLSGNDDRSDLGVSDAAGELAERYGTAILATGTVITGGMTGSGDGVGTGWQQTEAFLYDRLFVNDAETGFAEWQWPGRIIESSSTHGTGCTLASAIAVGLARGEPLPDAILAARTFVRLSILGAPGLGAGHGPMGQQSVRLDRDGPNQITLPLSDFAASAAFYEALGLTRIVDASPRYARFESANGVTVSIEAAAEMPHGPMLYVECDDLDAAVAAVRATGAVVSDPQDQSWGWREARTLDPAGNAICLYRAGEARRFPAWRIA